MEPRPPSARSSAPSSRRMSFNPFLETGDSAAVARQALLDQQLQEAEARELFGTTTLAAVPGAASASAAAPAPSAAAAFFAKVTDSQVPTVKGVVDGAGSDVAFATAAALAASHRESEELRATVDGLMSQMANSAERVTKLEGDLAKERKVAAAKAGPFAPASATALAATAAAGGASKPRKASAGADGRLAALERDLAKAQAENIKLKSQGGTKKISKLELQLQEAQLEVVKVSCSEAFHLTPTRTTRCWLYKIMEHACPHNMLLLWHAVTSCSTPTHMACCFLRML